MRNLTFGICCGHWELAETGEGSAMAGVDPIADLDTKLLTLGGSGSSGSEDS